MVTISKLLRHFTTFLLKMPEWSLCVSYVYRIIFGAFPQGERVTEKFCHHFFEVLYLAYIPPRIFKEGSGNAGVLFRHPLVFIYAFPFTCLNILIAERKKIIAQRYWKFPSAKSIAQFIIFYPWYLDKLQDIFHRSSCVKIWGKTIQSQF